MYDSEKLPLTSIRCCSAVSRNFSLKDLRVSFLNVLPIDACTVLETLDTLRDALSACGNAFVCSF
jgi:hypothetical protein